MGVKKKPTLKILFRQFAISLIVMLVAAIIVPSGLEGLAVNAGLATRANLMELQVKEIIPTLTIAPDITMVVIPQGCGYLILDKNFNGFTAIWTMMKKKLPCCTQRENILNMLRGGSLHLLSGKTNFAF